MSNSDLSRRGSLAAILAGGAFVAGGRAAVAGLPDPLSGAALYKDVGTYDALGEHRTATPGDVATSHWLARELKRAGLAVSLQPFAFPLFEPVKCEIGLARVSIAAFPAWPVVSTAPTGLSAELAPSDAASLEGKIALLQLAYKPGGSWAIPGYGDAVLDCLHRQARAVVAVTEGPTGGYIAINALPDRYGWSAPVVLAGGSDSQALSAAVGSKVTLTSVGKTNRHTTASNVIARRPGAGKTVVVSTPKSGWFHCAGERGSGIAIFLGLARWLVRETSNDLLFVATSGHEVDQLGSSIFLRAQAPAPENVRLWLHIGANAAVQSTEITPTGITFLGTPERQRQLVVSDSLLSVTRDAFSREPGYQNPVAIGPDNAAGELRVFQKAGYRPLAGLIGMSPLFHTRRDRADVATTPQVLEGTLRAACELMRSLT
jgi:hypothetical protein